MMCDRDSTIESVKLQAKKSCSLICTKNAMRNLEKEELEELLVYSCFDFCVKVLEQEPIHAIGVNAIYMKPG